MINKFSLKYFKILIKYFFIFLFSINCFSQTVENASQVLMPLEVYIGDHAEIRYTFRSPVDFFSGFENLDHADLINPFEKYKDKFSVIKSEIYRNDLEYTIRFVIIPWTNGNISFEPFNLFDYINLDKINSQEFDSNGQVGNNQNANGKNGNSQNGQTAAFENGQTENGQTATFENGGNFFDESNEGNFVISLFPIHVESIVEKTNSTVMAPPVPPLIVPGTTYVLFVIIVLILLFLILLFRLLFAFNKIKKKLQLFLKKREYKKNAELTIKKLKKILKNSKLTDIEYCSKLQTITRNYLEFKFDYRFSAISSSAMRDAFKRISYGIIPEEIAFAVEDIIAMFIRTDYIRYAHDSIDSQLYPPQEHQACLAKKEKKSLYNMVTKAIDCFENPEQYMEENNVN